MLKRLITPANGIAFVSCALATLLFLYIGQYFFDQLPSYNKFTCGSENPTGDCLGWSLVTLGPIYFLLYLFAVIAFAAFVSLPAVMFFVMIGRTLGRKNKMEAVDAKTLFTRIKEGSGPDA